MGQKQLAYLKKFFNSANIEIKWFEDGAPVIPRALGPALGFRYNLVLQAVSFRLEHISRCYAFLFPLADGSCKFIRFTTFDTIVGTLGYMARICSLLFALLGPFYGICSDYRGRRRNIIFNRDVHNPTKLRRHAKLILPLLKHNYWVKFNWFLEDLPQYTHTLFIDVSTNFGLVPG